MVKHRIVKADHHPEDQGGEERANADLNKLLHARLKDENKEHNQWVCYITFNSDTFWVNTARYQCRHVTTREAVLPPETEDQLEQALKDSLISTNYKILLTNLETCFSNCIFQ